MIELINITKSIEKKKILHNLSFTVNTGQCLALLGPSGCGKTTTLRLIAGLDALDQGEIRLNGHTVSQAGRLVPPIKRELGMVFQDLALWPHMTVRQNLDFALGGKIKDKSWKNSKIVDILRMVQMEAFKDNHPHQLSGGEKQRVAIARALVAEPKFLLLDEPFSNLDSELRNGLLRQVKSILTNTGITSIYVTHEKQDADLIADQTVRMKNGRVDPGSV